MVPRRRGTGQARSSRSSLLTARRTPPLQNGQVLVRFDKDEPTWQRGVRFYLAPRLARRVRTQSGGARRRATGKPRGIAEAVPLSAWWAPPLPRRAVGTPGARNKAERGFRFPLSAHSLEPAKGRIGAPIGSPVGRGT